MLRGRGREKASRRWVLVSGAAIAFGVGFVAPAELELTGTTTEAQSATRPNIVVVYTDDEDARMLRVMRNVKSLLRAQGTSFRRHYATFPLCCPSRATLLTGQYAHNHGVRDNRAPHGGYGRFRDRGTLPIALRRGGYRTGWIGKFLNGYGDPKKGGDPTEVPRGWDTWVAPVRGPHKMYQYTLNENGTQHHYGRDARDYKTDVEARKAVQFIRESAPSAQPFFLVLSPAAPHTESNEDGKRDPRPAPRHRNALGDFPYRTSPSFNERDVSDKPRFVRRKPPLDRSKRRVLRRAYYDRHRSMLAVDDAVGDLVSELERLGELDNTLVIYTSDNGFMLGEHRLKGKGDLYEESARVPLIMRGPGIPSGARRPQLTANVDLAPTILDVAGARPLLQMDGRSLLPAAASAQADRNRKVLLENRTSAAMRTQRYMYAEHPRGEREFYDLRKDPHQLRSRHHDREYAPVRRKLARQLSRFERCEGARCP